LAVFEFYNRTILYGETLESYSREQDLLGLLLQFFDGFKELKLSRAKSDDLYCNHLVPKSDELANLFIRIGKLTVNNSITCSAVFFALLACVVFVFSSYYPPSEILSITAVIVFLWTPIQTLDLSIYLITQSFAALDKNTRLEKRLQFKGSIGEQVYRADAELIRSFRRISLKDVCFSHKDREGDRVFTVGPVSVDVCPGEILFIMGGNGTGKSTLMRVMCGLYPLESGTVDIDGRTVDLADHRYLFAAVFSDFHLFERIYGVDDVDETKVNALLDLMQLRDSTAWVENRFTRTDLSTGQRKRLGLICTLLEDKPVLLFDEWAAEQSPQFRRYFYEELLPDLKNQGRAVVVITHDDQFTHVADRVIVLEREH
jgi:putative ATP-binding cassette transporter